MELKVAKWQYDQRRGLPLDIKVRMSQERIRQWYNHYDGKVTVSFSGGLDSTALLHLVRSIFPKVPAVFYNTGLEFPEIVRHVKRTSNVETIRPKRTFKWVLERFGWPIVSKRNAQYIHEIRNAKGETATKRLRLTGIKSNGDYFQMSMLPKKWRYLLDAPFKISDRCCYHLKKYPASTIVKRGLFPIVGTRAGEGTQRLQTYYVYGCNAFSMKSPRSTPLAFWTHDDVLNYINGNSIPYSEIYDMGYQRTGCVFCMFGVHLELQKTGRTRFDLLKETHPKLHNYCMNKLGMCKVMEWYPVRFDAPLFDYVNERENTMGYEKKMRYFLIGKGCSNLSLAEKTDYDTAGQEVRAGFSGRITLKEAKARYSAGTLAPDFVHDKKLKERLAHKGRPCGDPNMIDGDTVPEPTAHVNCRSANIPSTPAEKSAVQAAAENIKANGVKRAPALEEACAYCNKPLDDGEFLFSVHQDPASGKNYHPDCLKKFYAEQKAPTPSSSELVGAAYSKGHTDGYKQALTEMSGRLQAQSDALKELIAKL